MSQFVSVVIPAFNEELMIGSVVKELQDILGSSSICGEIIVVDDGSTDSTGQVARSAGARVLQHRSNRGYGASLKTGISAATHDTIGIIDADGTYPAAYLPSMFEGLERADMVVGARTGQNVHIPLVRRPAKWLLKHLANYVSGASIPDLNSGLRVFRRDIATQYFPILPNQFSFTTTITLAMHCDNYAVTYLPIHYRKRTGRSKIVPWDAGSFAILILRTAMLYRPLRVFVPAALLSMGYGLVKMTVDLIHDPNISASALLALISTLLIILIGMLGDSIATRLGKLNQNVVTSARPRDFVELDAEPSIARESLMFSDSSRAV
jgi:glycosyltransferase involved in cell wall biosynthesis